MENKEIKKQKETKNSNHSKFEVIPGKSKIAWDLPQSTLDYVMERFEKYIKENDISWQETWGPKTTDNYFTEMTKGSITTALRSKDQFVSKFGVFLRPKKDACFCMIINLKNVNQFISYLQLKIESLEQL